MEDLPTEKFVPTNHQVSSTKIGEASKFLADTGAQVNIANYDIFEIMGTPEYEKRLPVMGSQPKPENSVPTDQEEMIKVPQTPRSI